MFSSVHRQLGSLHTSCECPAGTSGPSCLDCHNGTISSCMLKCPGSSPGLGQHNKLHSKCSCQPNQQLTLPENSGPEFANCSWNEE
ncbi:hypothetical protein M8J77_005038 [Diaphorina citri]|nr:hypothetical protein M8J77_005038 [Diaphorina citri]